jgi:ABC-type amino acid transport substrate-binding protein
MKILLAVIFYLSSSTLLADNSFLKNKTVVGCENAEGYPPFIFTTQVPDELKGYSVDLLNLVFKDSGATIKYKLLPWIRCLAYAEEGEAIDIVLAAASTLERRKKYIFSDAFAKVHLAYFYDHKRFPEGLLIENPSDFDKLEKVCGMRGFVYGDYGLTRKVHQEAETFQQLIHLSVFERCDAILIRNEIFKSLPMAFPGFEYHARMKGGVIPWKKDEPIRFYFMAKKNSVYHERLINYINNRMKQIETSGQFNEIRKKYGFIEG